MRRFIDRHTSEHHRAQCPRYHVLGVDEENDSGDLRRFRITFSIIERFRDLNPEHGIVRIFEERGDRILLCHFRRCGIHVFRGPEQLIQLFDRSGSVLQCLVVEQIGHKIEIMRRLQGGNPPVKQRFAAV